MKLSASIFVYVIFGFAITNAQTIRYRYDKANRLIEADYPNYTRVLYSYDKDNNRTGQITTKSFANDVGIATFQSPLNQLCIGSKQVVVELMNYGSQVLSSATINWSINKKLQTSYTWKGSLKPDSVTNITLGTYPFPASIDTLKAWTSKPNGVTDSLSANDSSTSIFTVNALPQVNIRKSTSVCKGDTISIGSTSDSSYLCSWTSNPTGFTSAISNPIIKPTGTTKYILSVTDINTGCYNSDSVQISLNPSPVAAFSITNNGQCLSGNGFVDKSTIPSGSISGWKWDFGDGVTSSSQSPSHAYAAAGVDTVTLFVSSNKGCIDSASKIITLSPQPLAKYAVNNLKQCLAKNSYSFTDSSAVSSGNIASWIWDFGDGNSSSSQNPIHSYTKAGIYKVLLKVLASGCSDTVSKIITVTQSTANFNINNSTQCIDSNNFSFFDKSTTTTGSIISSWLWNFGDGDTSVLQNPSHSYLNSGTYIVKLTAINSLSCIDTFTQKVSIGSKPNAAFSINSKTQCLNSNSYDFIDSSSPTTGTITAWNWNFGDGNGSFQKSPIHSYINAGTFPVSLKIASSGSCFDSVSQVVTVNPSPNAHWTATVSQGKITFTLQNLNYKSYSWNFGNGDTSEVEGPVYTYKADGLYKISLVVTNAYGCTNEYDSSISIAITGIKSNVPLVEGLNIFPNPFQSSTTIQYNLAQFTNVKIELDDITGKEIAQIVSENEKSGPYLLNIDADKYNLNPGVYLLKFILGSQYVSRSIVKL